MHAERPVKSQFSLQPTFPFCICTLGLYLWYVEVNVPYLLLFCSVPVDTTADAKPL